LTGLSSVLRFSDAIFEPRAANRVVAASQADVQTATNNAVLAASEAYFDLLLASGLLAIEREATANAHTLAGITASYAKSGAGLEADHQRILTELDRRRGNIEDAVGQLEVVSANLVRLLVLDPNQVLAPVEPGETVFRLLPDETPLDDMIVQGLHQRPELASAQELVQATLLRLKQARLRPLVPSLAFSYAGGGFGGGPNAFFGNFGTRGDATVSLFWELQNLGFTDRAIARRSQAEHQTAALRLIKVENQVAADVTTAYKARLAASRRMVQAAPAVTKGLESVRLNMLNIQRGAGLPGATRPIEVLQPIQALAQARIDYLNAVLAYNRAQFRLYRALGQPPLLPSPSEPPSPVGPRAGAPVTTGR
jgi:outer membrane protein TolC